MLVIIRNCEDKGSTNLAIKRNAEDSINAALSRTEKALKEDWVLI